MRPQPTLTEILQRGLRHTLSDTDALLRATEAWVFDRIHQYSQAGAPSASPALG